MTLPIVVNFKIQDYNIPRKTFNVEPVCTIRWFKQQIVLDLKKMGIVVDSDQELNYGIARTDQLNQFLYFVSEHCLIDSLENENCAEEPLTVLFSYKSRMEYPVDVIPKQIVAINTLKNRKLLIQAMMNQDSKDVIRLLTSGLDPNFTLPDSESSPIFKWVSMNSASHDMFLNILVENGAHLDYRLPSGICPIHEAIKKQNLSAIKNLFCKGASLEEWDSLGVPAFFYAIDNDVHMRCLEFLLELGPNLSAKDSSKNNVIHFCVKKGLANHLELLLKHLSRSATQETCLDLLSSLNSSGNAPIHSCILQSSKVCLEILCRIKTNFSVKNENNETPLNLAIRCGDPILIKMISTSMSTGSASESLPHDTIPYSESLDVCKKYASTLTKKKNNNTKGVSYPSLFLVKTSFTARSSEELPLFEGETILVYLILRSKVGFGYKIVNNKNIYGWFPSHSIDMADDKKIANFQKNTGTFLQLVNHIPEITKNSLCPFVPLIVFLSIKNGVKTIGLEISIKAEAYLNEKCENHSMAFNVSNFYVHEIVPDSPAELSGLHIGDQILYIMSNDVTSFKLKTISTLIKTIIKQKVPPNLPPNSSRQLSFIVLRQSDMSINDARIFDKAGATITFNEASQQNSNIDTFTSTTLDCNPWFATDLSSGTPSDKVFKSGQIHQLYDRPLPEIPSNGIEDIRISKIPESFQNIHLSRKASVSDSVQS